MHKKNSTRFVLALILSMPAFQLCARDYQGIFLGGCSELGSLFFMGFGLHGMIRDGARYNYANKHMQGLSNNFKDTLWQPLPENREFDHQYLQYLWSENNRRLAGADFRFSMGIFLLGACGSVLGGHLFYSAWKDLPLPNYRCNPLDPQIT